MGILSLFKKRECYHLDESFKGHYIRVNKWLWATINENDQPEGICLMNFSKKDRYVTICNDQWVIDIIQEPDKSDMQKLIELYNRTEILINRHGELEGYHRSLLAQLE